MTGFSVQSEDCLCDRFFPYSQRIVCVTGFSVQSGDCLCDRFFRTVRGLSV